MYFKRTKVTPKVQMYFKMKYNDNLIKDERIGYLYDFTAQFMLAWDKEEINKELMDRGFAGGYDHLYEWITCGDFENLEWKEIPDYEKGITNADDGNLEIRIYEMTPQKIIPKGNLPEIMNRGKDYEKHS